MKKIIEKITILMVLSGLILPIFCFSQNTAVEAPKSFSEAKDFIIAIIKPLPDIIKDAWHSKVVPIWQKMAEKASNWYRSLFLPWFENILPTLKAWFNQLTDWLSDIWYGTIKPLANQYLDKIRFFIKEKITERKPAIQQEFQKEKQEMEQELPQVKESLWQRVKEFLQ